MVQLPQMLARLSRRPGTVGLAAGVLLIGVSVSAAATVFYAQVMYTTAPYPEVDRVVLAPAIPWTVSSAGIRVSRDYHNLREFEAIGIYQVGGMNGGVGESRRVTVAMVDAGFFGVMGIPPMVGRAFSVSDHGQRVAILAHRTWSVGGTTEFDHNATITLNGTNYRVIGVMPSEFGFPVGTEVWIPPLTDAQAVGGGYYPSVIARLAAGVSISDAENVLGAVAGPRNMPGRASTTLVPLTTLLLYDLKVVLRMLAIVTGLLLLAACLSAVSLLAVRLVEVRRELAIRVALGAGATHIAKHVFEELIPPVLCGGLAGAMVASWVFRGAWKWILELDVSGVSLGSTSEAAAGAVIGVGVATTVSIMIVILAFVFVGGIDARRLAREMAMTKAGATDKLAKVQIVIAVVLVAVAVSCAHGIYLITRFYTGIERQDAVLAEIMLPANAYGTEGDVVAFVDRLRAHPVIVGSMDNFAVASARPTDIFNVPMAEMRQAEVISTVMHIEISEGFFDAIGLRMRAGRAFEYADRLMADARVILNESAALKVAANPENALWSVVGTERGDAEVIGIVSDALRGVAAMYRPLGHTSTRKTLTLVMRPKQAGASIGATLGSVLREVDRNLPVHRVAEVSDDVRSMRRKEVAVGQVAVASATLAVVLGVIGVYGVTRRDVERRLRELAIRLACGASPGGLQAAVLWSVARISTMAAMAAVGLGAGLTRWTPMLQSLAVPVPSMVVWGLSSIAVIGVAIVAGWVACLAIHRIEPYRLIGGDN